MDALGRVASIVDALDAAVEEFVDDAAGRVVRVADVEGRVGAFSNDAAGQLAVSTRAEGPGLSSFRCN